MICDVLKCSIIECPFAYTDKSEEIQNYACLPYPLEILAMRVLHGKTWACHSDITKPCLGALKRLKELGYDNKVIDKELITESNVTDEVIKYDRSFYEDYKERDFKHISKLYSI